MDEIGLEFGRRGKWVFDVRCNYNYLFDVLFCFFFLFFVMILKLIEKLKVDIDLLYDKIKLMNILILYVWLVDLVNFN